MKKILFFLLALPLFLATHAATSPATLPNPSAVVDEPAPNANSIIVSIGNQGRTISLMELSHINVKDFETLTGKKLGFFSKIAFKLEQKRLRKNINADGTINSKALQTLASKMAEGDTGFRFGYFALGFFLPFWGILIALLIKDEHRKARIKWTLIGAGSMLVLLIIFAAALGGFA